MCLITAIVVGAVCLSIGWLIPQPQWFADGWAKVKGWFGK